MSVPAGPNERASDPVVAYDAVHRVWLISTLALEGQITRLTVSRSTDGLTWSAPVTAIEASATTGIAFDKNWIACDNGAVQPQSRPLLPRLHRHAPRRPARGDRPRPTAA